MFRVLLGVQECRGAGAAGDIGAVGAAALVLLELPNPGCCTEPEGFEGRL